MESTSYKKASTFYLIGNLFNRGIAFLTVPIFTRVLSTIDYGIVTTYNSWVVILAMIIGFATHMGIRSAFVDYRKEIDDVMSITTTFVLLVGSIFSVFIGLFLLFLEISFPISLVILCILQGLFSAVLENYSMYLMMQYKYKFRTALMILPNLISVCLSMITIIFFLKSKLYMGRIVATAVVTIGFGVLVILLIYKKSKMLFNNKYLKYILTISSPLILHGIALNILSQSDRTMITWLADASQTGIYSLVYNFSMLATVITTALDGVWIPWFTGKLKAGDKNSINKMSIRYINLITYAMFALILVGPEVIKVLASSEYWEGIYIIPPAVLANYVIFAYTLYVNIEHFYKKTFFITINTLIAAITNIILNYFFIPQYGYIAAAYTTLFSYLVAFVLHARYAKKLSFGLYPLKIFIKPLIHIVFSVSIFYLFMDKLILRWGLVILYLSIKELSIKDFLLKMLRG
ncbi:oligosaccharide flippase family protein [Clostridium paraputrificum]|uniref:oligosaccharide flippase family protein n=1 Tax=Clostridium paraputrificum TaxID=29363 RepID=UPI00232B3CC6|nr:oligosaccharide flippase family protein [Clostridium paraputrificum]MDB2111180.1 oligosaccharide flippase family protein [Clostridium paraputrificum]